MTQKQLRTSKFFQKPTKFCQTQRSGKITINLAKMGKMTSDLPNGSTPMNTIEPSTPWLPRTILRVLLAATKDQMRKPKTYLNFTSKTKATLRRSCSALCAVKTRTKQGLSSSMSPRSHPEKSKNSKRLLKRANSKLSLFPTRNKKPRKKRLRWKTSFKQNLTPLVILKRWSSQNVTMLLEAFWTIWKISMPKRRNQLAKRES